MNILFKWVIICIASNFNYLLGQLLIAFYLLTQTDHPIERVGKLTGFSDASRFIEIFKAETGNTPAKYRGIVKPNGVDKINFA